MRSPWLVLLLVAGVPQAGAAQDMTDPTDYWTDGYQPEDRGRRRQRRTGPASLDEAQQSGQGMVIGGGYAPRTVPEVYTVRRGDTLWDITGHFYGNPWEWPRVWSYNPEVTNPHWIYPLDRVRLLPAGAVAARLPTGRGMRVISAERGGSPESILLRDQGFLDADALRQAGTVAGSPEEQMLLSNFDEVYVQFGDDSGDVRAGQEYTVFRMMEGEERDPNEQGVLVRIFGTVLVRSYDRENRVARGVITESLDPIERGMRVAAIPRRFEDVEPVRNQVDLDAQVIASLRPQYLVGQYQIVFVNAGAEHGVRPGNRFFVVQQGDEWRQNMQTEDERDLGHLTALPPEPRQYPPEVIAEGRVVHVRPRTSALILARQTDVVEIGDRAEMRRGY